ncbi:tRNA (adenosine(37)-N6)-threonylcarbamoyltransferase complex transferase subunit TsaD [Pseudothermotoga thermarum]|uniref:tRNA N6-adenosine threonylcarbamoyltransferase n=1 Tax=Pseudothermotoga thermarum DSM 5069 TaxID=688269 RepID=F7YVF1_9THEM|nr:tRNA (adenosine(37)-N6)-threonylcarbamoyltransferase complex transferase subunit TsaD [Pseudothermotoga thermarum]AEH50454.1 O-sialoglycoprotein endopeptidase [Pseudothermotoga thermarum DSM 5069]
MPTVLAVETSCDETSVAIVKDNEILSNVVLSQISIHAPFGGVVPELAARHHLKNLPVIFDQAVKQAKIDLLALDAVAVTVGPGLIGALLVGLSFAKGLSLALKKPLIGVNHLLGHVYAAKLAYPTLSTPFIALIVSGGHTELMYFSEDFLKPKVLGRTVDDAAGEAFDKVARLLDAGYPGGPAIEKLAKTGDPNKFDFPKALMEKGNLNFSFAGLKTAVLYTLSKNPNVSKKDVAASFQKAVVEVLVEKTVSAAKQERCRRIVVSGGVAANELLRLEFEKKAQELGLEIYIPPKSLCTDNAAMIARAGVELFEREMFCNLDVNADPNLSF